MDTKFKAIIIIIIAIVGLRIVQGLSGNYHDYYQSSGLGFFGDE